uniref:Coat protein n=2 Tax=Cymbidium mosaic virus TaxID=12178 RepID=Q4A1I0_9VIRU|nr:coat protein [Cymbidium mosaic virus]
MGESTPAPAATYSAADPTSAPKLADLAAIKYSPVTSSIATPEEIKAITQLWVNNLGFPADTVGTAAIDLARAYADVGASKSATLLGFCPTKPDVRRAALAAQIFVANVTPRQFCAYYAKVVWNLMLATNDPPANWAKAGFQEDTRFAAFDFFDAVDSTAALEPAEWQHRPTDRERAAHSIGKYGALARQRIQNGNLITNIAEVTKGHAESTNTLYSLPAPPTE